MFAFCSYILEYRYNVWFHIFIIFLGANHADEMDYVFANSLTGYGWKANGSYTDQEIELSKAIVTLWTNFAATGYEHK